jgi:hypothetical protein
MVHQLSNMNIKRLDYAIPCINDFNGNWQLSLFTDMIAIYLIQSRTLGQLLTLWVAIVGVFALTILFGILATVYSVKQYRVSVGSSQLALALACVEQPTLPGFCAP